MAKPLSENIKITPKMIRAGASVLWNGGMPDYISMSPSYAETLAQQILERGLAARPRKRTSMRRRAA